MEPVTREDALIDALESPELDTRQRRKLLSGLRPVATERSVDVLRANLRCPDMKCRVRAVLALSRIGTDTAMDALDVSLRNENGPTLTFAVKALGDLRAEHSVPTLIRLLDERGDELDDGDKVVIIDALAKMPHRTAVPVLAAALHDSLKTRRAAAMALAQIRSVESGAALEDAATSMSRFQGAPVRRALRWRKAVYGE